MKEKKYLILGIATVLITLIGVTYAYFTTKIIGDRKNVTVDMAELKIIFNNGDTIEASDVYAEDNLDIVKTFSVENKTKNEQKYDIVFENLINSFKTTGYLVYKITSDDERYSMTDFEDIPKSILPSNIVAIHSILISANTKHNYNIEIKYINSETENQDEDQGAKLSGKLYITNGTGKNNLVSKIIKDNPNVEVRNDFSLANVETTTGTIYQTNQTEDDSTVYYYSGNTTNNWVKFGKYTSNGPVRGYYSSESLSYKEYSTIDECSSSSSYNINCKYAWNTGDDMYWRIIRTNEDGSVRILYSGTSHDTSEGYIGESEFNDNNPGDYIDVGYMYGISGSLTNNRINTNDSIIKTYIDTWYENNLLTNYDKYISKSAIYCNDRSASKSALESGGGFGFGVAGRVKIEETPTYKCGGDGQGGLIEDYQAVEDKFSVSTEGGGNGQLKYPIALMTADEYFFAGWKKSDNTFAKSWVTLNSKNSSIISSQFLLSPGNYSYNDEMLILGSGASSYRGDYEYISYTYVTDKNTVRPTISLSSCVQIKSGNGTPESPYEIDYDNSCN